MENKKKILIVEDERPMGSALLLKLNSVGFDAIHVQNGEEALERIQEDSFDIILLDLMMPKMNGFGLLENMQAKELQIPVIVLSNLSQPEDEERAKKFNIKGFFVKSNSSLNQIVEHVQSTLEGKL